jgi:hypothetical protein
MGVHLLHALTPPPLWARYGTVSSLSAVGGGARLIPGKQQLTCIHLVPQETVATMKEDVTWIATQITGKGIPKRSRWS